ncbi:DUF881 domain-containing protein [Clostridium sp. CM028]|uniref:DUF881 domain-containing protein n=1 Tax=unclassified Clostridium TaxID=2614128 RepID=UPI001C0D013C|nr:MULTISPECIES: DUF881 domain-containing protein [unclassified Clostridium]MBU3091517.1 DUF881 domain-containing protein [Clostridium sp. CF011]MBW9144219.1 DUF881 domain-containing protein [Clostridium sp. CM027]MBW9147471.1 DUF881 domain-containing protein [Clostridium sp. CM028]UVE41143.1 DUF881 domain-containing protein [Clostridium sp. CM027]WAG70138.1 DUF881 domain-containing protein [Clostridium sp. CF011]
MKKFRSQISIGIVCVLLGFMISYQFKMIGKQNSAAVVDTNKNTPEIITENEQLKISKEVMQKKIDDLDAKTAKYEKTNMGDNEKSELLYKELEETRILTGQIEVEGQGIIVYIDPKSDIFGSNTENQQAINDVDLAHIVNELNSVGAEAISINDIRLTTRSGIRNAGNAIIINDERISYSKRVTIKAIGDKTRLEGAIKFPGTISQFLSSACDVTTNTVDKVVISKYNKVYKFEYARPVEKK